jgi:hypothetical protein
MHAKLADFGLSTIVEQKLQRRRDTVDGKYVSEDAVRAPSLRAKLLRTFSLSGSETTTSSGEPWISVSNSRMLKSTLSEKGMSVVLPDDKPSLEIPETIRESTASDNSSEQNTGLSKALPPNDSMMKKIRDRRRWSAAAAESSEKV